MAKPPSSAQLTIKGTRNNDTIAVDGNVVTVTTNGVPKPTTLTTEQVAAGLLLKGDAGNDTITGGSGPDVIDGGDGNDTLSGGGGADNILGGAGNDRLIGTLQDRFDGGRDIDTLDLSGLTTAAGVDIYGTGTFWTDVTITHDSNGYALVDLGDTELTGVARNIENIIGTAYDDWLIGNNLENVIHGGAGNDAISAAHNDGRVDRLFGDDGNDALRAGGGNDELTGGAGEDMFTFDPASSNGKWVVHDYDMSEGDSIVLFPYDGDVSWSSADYLGTPSLQATFDGGDTMLLVGVTDVGQVDLVSTIIWPGP